ncbi:MAG TPA: CBS domain-containing protein, partial [Acidimicrobiales bacterium]|nr:CBS domain-containing protein [Acidimicrobiales bacterium]
MARPWRRRRADQLGHDRHHPPTEEEREIIFALTALRDTTAREVMTPRVDIVALETPVTVGDAVQAVRVSGHSRFPVYRDDLDNLVGVLFVKDLFQTRGALRPEEPI